MARALNSTNVPSPAEWRAAMGYFPTGVTIVTSWQDKTPVGTTVNAFCSVSLEPPMLLICLDLENPLRGPIEQCGVFGINILAEDGHDLAKRFAALPEISRLADVGFRSVGEGAPQLHASPMFIDCTLECVYPAGDHFVFIGRGVRTERSSAAPPLLYHKGCFPKLGSAI
jgi:3-hydroxy-9,10-secoandrosta-1,3,5(10)-triene-9,17-dione monooxygenase reductase component